MKIRINKYLASIGVGSRRRVDEYISQGRVLVNDVLATPGTQVDPEDDKVCVDNKIVQHRLKDFIYYVLNKPVAVVSTCYDDEGRDTVLDFVPKTDRLYPVGRLDYNTSGLIILTNDGDLTLKLTHPRYHLAKTYRLNLKGNVPDKKILEFNNSVLLEDGPTIPGKVENILHSDYKTIVELTIFQGRNRQVRRMCDALGFKLYSLERIAIGPIEIGSLRPGEYQKLTKKQIELLLGPSLE